MTAEIGHNRPPLDFADDVASVLATGTLAISLDRLCDATLDPRLERSHLIVLAVLIQHMNYSSGTAWPSRETIASKSRLSVKTVNNTLYELRSLGYVSWGRRRIEGSGRTLLNYTLSVAQKPKEQLLAEINAYIASLPQRQKLPRPRGTIDTPPAGHAPSVGQQSAPPVGRTTAPPAGEQELSTRELLEGTNSLGANAPARELDLTAPEQPKPEGEKLFDEFWTAYPRKIGKTKAHDAFIAIVKGKRKGQRARAEIIIAAAREFSKQRRGKDPQYTPHPATWLNQGRWDDEHDETVSSGSPADEARRRFAAILGGDK